MTSLREIKAFVTKREIGDAILAHRQGKAKSVVEGRIFDFHLS
jgi:hypothetical protein